MGSMADQLVLESFVSELLEREPDGERDLAAIQLLGAVAAHLTLLVGGRSASAAIYSIADMAATRHIPVEGIE
jgi:hypothetical protein